MGQLYIRNVLNSLSETSGLVIYTRFIPGGKGNCCIYHLLTLIMSGGYISQQATKINFPTNLYAVRSLSCDNEFYGKNDRNDLWPVRYFEQNLRLCFRNFG